MRFLKKTTIFVVMIIIALFYCTTASAEESKKGITTQLVRVLGYGGAIHQYKNYVLRGTEKYRYDCSKKFAEAKKLISAFQALPDLTAEDRAALMAIDGVVDQYIQSLVVIENIYSTETSLAKILSQTDIQVQISNQAAIEGLITLRKNQVWSALDELEYQLGYGNAIHNFKNYVIRGKDKYYERADLWFVDAKKSIKVLKAKATEKKYTLKAIGVINTTVDVYRAALPTIKKNYAKAKGIKSQIVLNVVIKGSDNTVKIDDSEMIKALAELREEK